jgi:putative hemolysin
VTLALVHDEYGHLEGIVTPADLLDAIAGTFVAHGDDGDTPMLIEREDGSLLIRGPARRCHGRPARHRPARASRLCDGCGLCSSVLRKLPHEGEHFTSQGWRFEVVDMDGRKIDKLLAARIKTAAPAPALDG